MGHATIRGNKHIAGHDMPLKASDTSIAQVLKRSGYSTGVFGKWGLGYFGTSGAPKAKGFDTFYGQLGQGACHNYYPTKVDASDASGIRHVPIAENKGATRKKCMSPGNTCVFSPDLFVKKGLEWMKQQKGTPFFMYLALTPPHAGGYPPNGKQTGAPVPRQGIYKKKPWPTVEKDHAAQVTYAVDAYVGKVVENLKAMGEYKNTLVIFTSDNGPHNEGGKHDVRYFDSAGPLRGFKRSLYEGGIRIPMIMSWPGKIKPSSKSREPIAFWDFLPTLGKIGQAASSVPKNIDGVDISPIFAGKKLPKRALYWEFCTNKKWGHAIRFGDWKAVSFSLDGPMELYNIRKDRGEKHNLAKKNRKLVKALEAKAKTMRSSDKEWPKKNCVTS
jgi:arylsulfatase A-like enzyme